MQPSPKRASAHADSGQRVILPLNDVASTYDNHDNEPNPETGKDLGSSASGVTAHPTMGSSKLTWPSKNKSRLSKAGADDDLPADNEGEGVRAEGANGDRFRRAPLSPPRCVFLH